MNIEKEDLVILKVISDLSENMKSIGLITIDQKIPGKYFNIIESGSLNERVYKLHDLGLITLVEPDHFKISEKGIEKLKFTNKHF